MFKALRAPMWPVVALVVSACPRDNAADGREGVEDLTIVVEADRSRILEAEQQLLQKKQTVEEERTRVERERADIVGKLSSLSKKDKKQREQLEAEQGRLKSQEDQLRQRESSVEGERSKLESEKTKLLDRITQLTATQGGGMTIQQREENMARREQRVGDRERKIAEREKELADRETEVTKNLQALAGLMGDFKGVRTIAVPAAGPAPANVSRNDVQKLQRQVKTRMDSKGILLADLPPAARDLDTAAKSAINSKDFAAAHTGLEQLSEMIDTLKVDHTFVQAKFTRINRSYDGKVGSLDEGQRKRVSALLDEVSESFSDGRYDRANRKINQIHSLLEGGSE